MGKLIAMRQFCYKGKEYILGMELPGDDAEMVEAWKRAGSVREEPEEDSCDVATNDIATDLKDSDSKEPEEDAQTSETAKEGKRKK